jgi:hypothetical protein
MRALSLLLFTLLAGPAVAQETGAPVGCKEDNADCKENCTVEYGSSSRTYARLGTCLQKCKQTYDKCTERHFALQKKQQLGIEPHSGPELPPEPGEPKGSAASTPASRSEPGGSTGRTGVYRASESKTVADPEPKPESKAAAKPVPEGDPADELAKAMDPESAQKPEPAQKPGAKAPAKSEPGQSAPADLADTQARPALDQDVPAPLPEPKPEPQAKPEPKPKPQPKSAPAKQPAPKRDIDDWDPNEK